MFEILKNPVRDYFRLRVHNLNSDEFRHLWLLLYWPVFGILFGIAERIIPLEACHEVYCRLDDYIPFVEYFVIPYVFWYVYLIGMHIYTLLYDVNAFRKLMKFIMITYTVTLVIYLLWPNCQMLRPSVFERDNIFTRFMADFYAFDTNTNVCPSLHVAGSLAVCFTSWHCRGLEDTSMFSGKIIRHSFNISAILISVSTVFLKQHSVIDIIAALALCIPAYWYCFRRKTDTELCSRQPVHTEDDAGEKGVGTDLHTSGICAKMIWEFSKNSEAEVKEGEVFVTEFHPVSGSSSTHVPHYGHRDSAAAKKFHE